MNKKRKFLKRMVALFGVLVVLASSLLIPVGAWEKEEISFYNYFDCSVFSATKDIGNRKDIAQILSSDCSSGYIKMYSLFDGLSSPYVPPSYADVTLSKACPSLTIGETYVLSGDAYYEKFANYSSYVEPEMFPCVVLRKQGADDIKWYIGESLTITADMLDRYIMIYSGSIGTYEQTPVPYYCYLRLWINKDKPAPFLKYNFFEDMHKEGFESGYNCGFGEGEAKGYGDGYEAGCNDGYDVGFTEGKAENYDEGYALGHADGYSSGFTQGENKGYDDGYKVGREDGLTSGKEMGYDDGYNDGYEANIMDNLMVSKKNLSLQISFYDRSTGQTTWKSYGDVNGEELNYPFNGYSFNSRLLDTKYTTAPSADSYLNGILVMLIPQSYGANYVVGSSQLSVTSYNDTFNIFYITIVSDALGGISNPVTARYGTKGAGESILVNFADFGLKDGDVIDSLSIEYREPNEANPIKKGFSFAFTDTSGNAFTVGMEEGKSQGLVEGYKNGYADGNTDGYNTGYEEGHDRGYDSGYADGDNTGYYRGRSDESKKSGFFGMIYSVIDAPVSVLSQTLNFDILGVNMKGLASSLITFAILVTVVKLFV